MIIIIVCVITKLNLPVITMKLHYLFLSTLILAVCSLFIGATDIRPADLLNMQSQEMQIFLISRIPRLVAIILAGASMSIAGLIMQSLSRNKFVSPTTAGTLDATRLGILIAMIAFTNVTYLQKITFAFLFSLVGTFLFMQLLNRVKWKDAIFIPLVGLMFGNILTSITTFFAYKADIVQNVAAWLMGDFSLILKGRYELLYISVPILVFAYLYASRFTIAGMGEDFAKNVGLSYNVVVNLGLVFVALLSTTVVLTVGVIPFLGLIIPNIVSIFKGDHLEKTLPHTALLGVVFLLACDMIGRLLIFPYEIPIGLTVGVIGSAVFLTMLFRGNVYAR